MAIKTKMATLLIRFIADQPFNRPPSNNNNGYEIITIYEGASPSHNVTECSKSPPVAYLLIRPANIIRPLSDLMDFTFTCETNKPINLFLADQTTTEDTHNKQWTTLCVVGYSVLS